MQRLIPMHSTKDFKPGFLLERSSFLQEIVAEKRQVLDHKWFESEKAGFDIGYDKALNSWVRYHRSNWLKQRRAKSA